jgi:phosphoribosylaminoimidazole-succinocarboxamide synthase
MGSVKDLSIVKKPTTNEMGIGRFHFSDRYSVFDWGEMPDQIEGKGQALCMMGAYCFEKLAKKGIKTHYKGLVDQGKTVSFQEIKTPSDIMEVSLVNVYKPIPSVVQNTIEYDYSTFTPNLTNFLLPLEIIYRNGLPEGSSVFKRIGQGKTTPQELGLDHIPKPGEQLLQPILDVSTKLEETDRYIIWAEAQKIAGLTPNELTEIKSLLSKVNNTISEIANKASLQNEDGKIELAFDTKRKLMVVDVVGTLDECRFTYKGLHVSKEIARQFYKRTAWYQDAEEAKKTAEIKGIADWRTICKSKPPKLDDELRTIISEMYRSAANELTDRNLFDVPSIVDVIEDYKQYMSE